MPDGSERTDVDSIPHSNVDGNRRVQELYLEGLPNCSIFRCHQHSSMMGMVSLGIDKCPGYRATHLQKPQLLSEVKRR